MSDLGRDGAIEEDRLPWLEPVDDENVQEGGVAAGKLLGALFAALLAIGLIIGGSFWLRQRNVEVADNGAPATIPAPPGPYKIKPADAGGMQVPGEGDASHAASTGADPNAQIDVNAVPEAPIAIKLAAPPAAPVQPAAGPAKPGTPGPAKPVTAQVPTTTAKLPATPAATPTPPQQVAQAPKPVPAPAPAAAGGQAIQLGSFSSQAKADNAWKSLTGRFAYLGALTEQVVTGTVGGNTVYRLRAAGAGAAGVCSKLKVAGETCIIAK